MASKNKDKEKQKETKNVLVDSKHLDDGSCVICCDEIKIFAVGACDHPICYRCSARMRVLSEQTYCPSCRAEMTQVVITFQVKKFIEFSLKDMKMRKPGFCFEDWRLTEQFDALFDNACADCDKTQKPFVTFEELKTHIRRVHEKQFCQICLDSLSIFSGELKMYTKKELVTHRKDGDVGDKSHRGHPECKFCNDRFADNDALLLHLRKSHFWCHFCEHDGKQEYYNIYKDLRTHFGKVHFLCDEGECRYEKFTSVFRDKIDYQAHKLASHGKNFNKSQAKEARKIEFDYNYKKREPTGSAITGKDYVETQQSSEARSSRGADPEYRDYREKEKEDRNKMDFSNFVDVERERRDIKKEKRKLQQGRGKTSERNEEESRREDEQELECGAPARIASSDYQRYLAEQENDVIGVPEYINNAEDQSNRVHDGGGCDAVRMVNNDRGARPATPKAEVRVERKKEQVQKEMEEAEDFPALGKVVKLKQEHTQKLPGQKLVQDDFPALGKPVKPKAQQNDYPALGKPVKAKQQKPQKQPPKQDDYPALGKSAKSKQKQQQQQLQQQQQQQPQDDFPMLGGKSTKPKQQQQKDNFSASAFAKSTKPKSKQPQKLDDDFQPENDFPVLSKPVNVKQQQLVPETYFPGMGEPLNTMQVQNHFNDVISINSEKVKKNKEKGKSWSQQSGRANLALKNDESEMNKNAFKERVEEYKLSNGETKVIQMSKNKQNGTCTRDEPPKVKSNGVVGNSKGPPGFTTTGKKGACPPGFTASNPPENNMRERNTRLVNLLQTYLDDFNLQIFKNVSGNFRKDLTPASIYYEDISELLGDNLKYVFNELVSLLPDEEKREELLKLHNTAKLFKKEKEDGDALLASSSRSKADVWGSSCAAPIQRPVAKTDEIQCGDCGVTLPRDQMLQHMEMHGNAFPSLPTAVQKKGYAPPLQKSHQSRVKNPWTK